MGGISALDAELGFTEDEKIVEMYAAKGTGIEISEVRDRLSSALFEQLRDGSDKTIIKAVNRALIHAQSVFAKGSVTLDLDVVLHREIVLNLTLYELHMALGHEEAGREYRLKARDLFDATLEVDSGSGEDAAPVAVVNVPAPSSSWF